MRRIALVGALLACLALPGVAVAAPGDLDESFSADGLVTGIEAETVVDTEVLADGSILVAHNAGNRGRLTGFAPNGDLGQSFSGGLGAGENAIAAIDLDGEGDIIVGGSGGASHPNDFSLVELGLDGFPLCGGTGLCFIETDFAGGADRLRDVIAAAGGLTVAAGVVTGPAGAQLGVARYLPDGTLDASFSGDGKLIVETGGGSSFAKNAVVHSFADGSILLAGAGPAPDGSGRGDLLLMKLKPDGDVDPSFGGGDGFTTLDIDGRDDAASIAIAPGGEIVVGVDACAVGLTTDCQPALARFTSGGELDPGFGSGGLVWPAAGAEVQIAPDGSLLAAGSTRLREYFQIDFALGRYTSDGTPDATFSGDGVATADFELGLDRGFALALMADGRPVLAGTTSADSTRLALARFEIASGPPDADADAILDAEDRCPERFGTPRTGCPRIDRDLKIKAVKGGRLKAKIGSEIDSCQARQPVKVQARESGRWITFARGRTGVQGNLVTRRPVPDGRYRANAKATVGEPLGRCAGVRSKPLAIR